VIFARHGESEYSVAGLMNGDPSVPVALTASGRRQAAALGARLASRRLDLCVTSAFERARETAEIALAARDVPRRVCKALNDIVVGAFEGKTLAEYRAWAHAHDPHAPAPGGGESRVESVGRYLRAFAAIAALPDSTVLVIAHGLPIRYVLNAARGEGPVPVLEQVAYAEPYELSADELGGAIAELEAWRSDPAWASSASP